MAPTAASHRLSRIWSSYGALILAGSVLFGSLIGVRLLAPAFEYGHLRPWAETGAVIGLLVVSGCALMSLRWVLPRIGTDRRVLLAACAAGLAARLLFFGSVPIYEDDWYRYLWDGAVTDAGVSPYAFPPADAAPIGPFGHKAAPADDERLRLLQTLAAEEPQVFDRINYPYVSTIYPPLAQAGFWLAHKIAPFDLDGWRLLLLLADGLGLALLMRALSAAGRGQQWVLLYWWNPIIIVFCFNAGHMDILLTPLLAGAYLFMRAGRGSGVALTLAGAVAVKFWPALLAPLLLAGTAPKLRRFVLSGSLFLAAGLVLLLPMLLTADFSESGLSAYAESWQRNAFLFPALSGLLTWLGADGALLARGLVAVTIGSAALYLALRLRNSILEAGHDKAEPAAYALAATACLYLLSPTGYPWYALWLFVWLPFAPAPGLLALTATLPLYFARFPLEYAGAQDLFAFVLAAVQFLIPIGLLILYREWRRV